MARLVGEHDTRLWWVRHHYVDLDQARQQADFSTVTHVGVDETSARRGQNYITLFCDLDEARCCSPPKVTTTPPSAAFAST